MLSLALTALAGVTLQLGPGSFTASPAAAAPSSLQRTLSTPDGLIVFLADRETDGVNEIWASGLDGSAPWRVNAPLPPGVSLGSSFYLAPDGQHVAYYGLQIAGEYGLYVAPIDGSSFAQASQPGDNLQSSSDDPWSPEIQYLAYTAKSGTPTNLWVVRPDGSARTQLSSIQHMGNGGVSDFAWAPNSSRIAYRGDVYLDNQYELFTATPDGLVGDRVNPPLPSANMDIDRFAWSPNSQLIACHGDVGVLSDEGLYVAAADGAGFHSVTHANALTGAFLQQFEWTPNSQRLVFVVNASDPNVLELFTVRADGSGWIKLSGAMPVNGDVRRCTAPPVHP